MCPLKKLKESIVVYSTPYTFLFFFSVPAFDVLGGYYNIVSFMFDPVSIYSSRIGGSNTELQSLHFALFSCTLHFRVMPEGSIGI